MDEKNGIYSVKSEYKNLLRSRDSTPFLGSINWNLIWKLRLPAKVRNFVWRALTSSLPTMKVLLSKRVDGFEACPICHNEAEDDFHALVSCPYARAVWSITSLGSSLASSRTLIEWWNNIAILQAPKDIEITSIIMWSLWKNRNNVVWNDKSSSVSQIYLSALDLDSQWHEAHICIVPNQQSVQPHGA